MFGTFCSPFFWAIFDCKTREIIWHSWPKCRLQTRKKKKNIYIYICCRRGFGPILPFFQKQKNTFPAAERSVARGRILSNMTWPKTGYLGDQILLYLGPVSPLTPSVPISPFLTLNQFLRNLYFCAVSGVNRAIFEMAPKMPKTLLPESVAIWCRFGGGGFLYNRPPFFLVKFLVWAFSSLKPPRLLKPLIL